MEWVWFVSPLWECSEMGLGSIMGRLNRIGVLLRILLGDVGCGSELGKWRYG
jgi:hypothetical protein